MSGLIRQAAVIARRDFLAVVATPTFLMFLLAPLFMIGFGIVGGSGATQVAASSEQSTRIAIIATEADARALKETDARMRVLFKRAEHAPPKLAIIPPHADQAIMAKALFASKKTDYAAVLYGTLERPTILQDNRSQGAAQYLAEIAEQTLRDRRGSIAFHDHLSRATLVTIAPVASSLRGKQAAGYVAVFGIFILTLFLAGQAVGMLAEEKSNKVIEILAAAVPLEAVFLGKLVGMFGVATLFVSFWGVLGAVALSFAPAGVLTALQPAVGMPVFMLLCACYFATAYMLLGAVFLGVGSLAATMREIQMLSLPITVFQIGMFGLSSSAAANPGSKIARFAEIFPFSSPFAMAARAATDSALFPHVLALLWQALWVAITIGVAARLFRIGVLKTGVGPRAFIGRRLSRAKSI
ncbi:MAG: ABC transporter permease [Chakrabartia sp.]